LRLKPAKFFHRNGIRHAFFGNDSSDQAKPLYKAAAGVNDPGCTPKRSNA